MLWQKKANIGIIFSLFSCLWQFAETPTFPSYVTSGATGTTPTLTPTTLASIEQTFIELTSTLGSTHTTNTTTYSAQDLSRQSGFVPPVINPSGGASSHMGIKTEQYSDDDDSEDAEWMPPGAKRRRDVNGRVIEITPSNSPASMTSTPGPRRHTGPRPRRNEHVSTSKSNFKRSGRVTRAVKFTPTPAKRTLEKRTGKSPVFANSRALRSKDLVLWFGTGTWALK